MRPSRGFTLIEVVVALAISGIVVLLAQRVFAAAGDASRELRAAREALDRETNARRWLQAAFLSLDVGGEGGGPFSGRPDRAEFGTWLQRPGGWMEQRRAVLEVAGGGFRAHAGDEILLADSVTRVEFDYLLEPGADTKWVREWISPVSAPLAVRLRIARGERVDTLLFLIKERG